MCAGMINSLAKAESDDRAFRAAAFHLHPDYDKTQT